MIHTQDADFTLLCGDVLDELATLPDESVHCVVTSPPYWGLRDYGTGLWDGGDPDCDHKGAPLISDKSGLAGYTSENVKLRTFSVPQRDVCGKCGAQRQDKQLGLEPTPDQYVARMVEVFREVRRVLRTDGTCWVNLGDSYAAGPAGNTVAKREIGNAVMRQETADALMAGARRNKIVGGLKPKDLVGIPWRVAFALQQDGWYLRADIIWAKPNPMPESVTDRPTKAHEYVFLLTKSARYFFDQDAVREPHQYDGRKKLVHDHAVNGSHENYSNMGTDQERWPNSGRNVRSVWNIATQPYPEAHFATYPEELVRRCILAGTSERGCCPVCGKPWEREVAPSDAYREKLGGGQIYRYAKDGPSGPGIKTGTDSNRSVTPEYVTLGWRPGCDCGSWMADEHYPTPIPCTVLDPFLGSGTTAYVARKHGRRSIGIELNPAYAELAAKRMAQQSLFALEGTP